MKVLFIARPNLYIVSGGDTVQIDNTAKFLRKLGVEVDILLSDNKSIRYQDYDLMHLFNIIDCEDLLGHAIKCHIPYVISTIYVDYSEYDTHHRRDLVGKLAKIFSTGFIEYAKTIAKFVLKGEPISNWRYFLYGHNGSIRYLLRHATYLLPNSTSEYKRLLRDFGINKPHMVVVNAIDKELFNTQLLPNQQREDLVVCMARIEGMKNQLNLIKAVAGKPFKLKLIGKPSDNQKSYVKQCYKAAESNTTFIPPMRQTDLLPYYVSAKVHALPSWSETTGLSSLEAAALGCNIVIADKGDVREYFGDLAYYCEPSSPESIAAAIELALKASPNDALQKKVRSEYTWEKAAEQTLAAYKTVLTHD